MHPKRDERSDAESGMTIYRAEIAEERAAWIEAWKGWSERAPHTHPAYVEVFLNEGEKAVLASGEGVFMPMVVRPLGDGRCDLVTPYGYGGPYRSGKGDEERFWDALDAWARSVGAVTLFARMPLFDAAPFRGETIETQPNVAVDLTGTPEDLWQQYDPKVRRGINRAQRANFELEIDPSGANLDGFLEVYASTMDRRNALDGYRFGREFFEKIVREMPESVCFFHAKVGGRTVSSDMVLYGGDTGYLFLSGTDMAFIADMPNYLLKHVIHEWLAAKGVKRFVMGGGYTPGDGVFYYKSRFSRNGLYPFSLGRRTFDSATARALVEERKRREPQWEPQEGFFPIYRAPATIREEVAA